MVTHEVAEQQPCAALAAVAQPPGRLGARAVGRLRDAPLTARVGVPGVEALATSAAWRVPTDTSTRLGRRVGEGRVRPAMTTVLRISATEPFSSQTERGPV